jgi:porphobilinogen deaminase
MDKNQIQFKGQVLSVDGTEVLEANEYVSLEGTENAGFSMADILIAKGADRMIRQIKERLQT